MKTVHIRVEDELYEKLNAYSYRVNRVCRTVSGSSSLLCNRYKKKKKDTSNKQFSFIDLFAGIGGMRIAFDRAGGHCVYSNEWNKYSQQTYFANFGEQPDGDITCK